MQPVAENPASVTGQALPFSIREYRHRLRRVREAAARQLDARA